MRNLVIIISASIALHLNAVTSIQGKVFFPDGLNYPYTVCVITPEGEETYRQCSDSIFTIPCSQNQVSLSIASLGYETITKELCIDEQNLIQGVYNAGTMMMTAYRIERCYCYRF